MIEKLKFITKLKLNFCRDYRKSIQKEDGTS